MLTNLGMSNVESVDDRVEARRQPAQGSINSNIPVG